MRFTKNIRVIETHTAGMPTRIVVSGFPRVPGATMAEKVAALQESERLQGLGDMIIDEPRGHSGQFGALLTEPVSAGATAGVVFFSPRFYHGMCGHATIGVATALVETGVVSGELPLALQLDTPVGTVIARVEGQGDCVERVTVRNVPGFLYREALAVDVPGIGTVDVDLSFGGNLYAFVWAPDLGVRVRLDQARELRRVGTAALAAIQQHVERERLLEGLPEGIPHRLGAIMLRDDPQHPDAHQKNMLMGASGFDRSPCGTGTCGWMAALSARGKLEPGTDFVHESLLGTLFTGRVTETVQVGGFEGVVPEVSGNAFITAFHDLVLDPRDPYPRGFRFDL